MRGKKTGLPPAPPPLLLTAEDVARMLTCSVKHVRRLASAGTIPAPLRVGHMHRWRYADIAAWVSARPADPAPLPQRGLHGNR